MRKIKLAVFMFLLCLQAFAQGSQNTVVKGVVLDSLTRAGEPAAILQFYRLPDLEKAVAFTTTDEEGKFSHSFTLAGDYVMVFDNMGRKVQRRSFTVPAATGEVDLGEILAQDSAELLKAGQVTAMRQLVKMEVDKMIYNVVDDVDSKTSTVLDMLRKVPMVTVDGQDKITVNGSSSFKVYVDGKPNQMMSQNASTVFKVMPASMVKSIEVITNPGVKYDAEGVGGVLNITTNKEVTGGKSVAEGFYGTLQAMASTNGYGGGLFTSMQKGKFALSANIDAMQENMPVTTLDMTRTQDSGFSTATHSETGMKLPMIMADISASYDIDEQNLLSASFGLMRMKMDQNGTSATDLLFPGQEKYRYTGTTSTFMTDNTIEAGLDYQHLWADVPARSLTLSYQFNGTPGVNNTLNTFGGAAVPGYDLTDRRSDGKSNSLDHTLQADFTTPLGSVLTLSTGAKFIWRHNSSSQCDYRWDGSEFVLNPASSLDYDFYNRIGAGYAELSGNVGNWGLKGGARYEHTWQTYSSVPPLTGTPDGRFDVNYGALVPSASVQYNLSAMQNIGLSYNMRISRPGITYLNPYVDTTDPTALSYGNPDLEVERSHNLSLVYSLVTPKLVLNATLRQGYTGNGISSYSFFDDKQVLNTTYGNIVTTSSTGLNTFLMINPTNKTRIMVNGGISYNDISSKQLGQQNKGVSYNVMVGGQQTLPWDLRLSANFITMGSQVTLQGSSTGMSLGTLGLTKTFLDDRLSLSVSGILPLARGFEMNMSSTTRGDGFSSVMNTTIPMRQINFQVSWTFGKQGNYGAKKARRGIENDSQLNSASKAESMGSIMKM